MTDNKGLALVTGASSGIGRSICVELAKQGFDIFVDHYRDESGAQETLNLVRETGRNGWSFDADVGSAEETQALFSEVAACGKLKVLVNNAAIQTFAPLIELAEADFDRTIRTNLKGTFL
ncbi:MAG: SDR family NAD(P)-dependent oxidoreductase, partial [Planctomycetota bacterium]